MEYDSRHIPNLPFAIVTPKEPGTRGSEMVLEFAHGDNAKQLKEWLRAQGISVGFRYSPFADSPRSGIIRAGFNPLFNSFEDVFKFGAELMRFRQ